MNNHADFDIGPLTWVKGEIDLALSRASETLKLQAELVAKAPTGTPDMTQLKAAQAHVHQAHGALAIVGLGGVTQFLAGIEQILVGVIEGKFGFTIDLASSCRRALDTVSAYLDELLSGVPDRPLRLFPVYRDLLALAGVAVPSAADLFFPDLSQRPPKREREPAALAVDALAARLKAARLGFQRGLLKWLKGDVKGLTEMRNSMAVIEFSQAHPSARAFWWISLGYLDALVGGGIQVDANVKKLCGRIDAQIAKLLDGTTAVPERLTREVLYYVATTTIATPHVECVRAAYRLAELLPQVGDGVTASDHLSQLRAMREALEAAKEEWGRYTTQIPGALGAFHGHTKLLVAQGQSIGQLDLARLVSGIGAVADMLVGKKVQEPGDSMALEVATALLLADNAIETFAQLGVDFAHQVDAMAGRLTALLRGETPAALQAMAVPQLDEISRKAQERLLMNQVVREILGTLGGVEQKLDAFFRDPVGRLGELSNLKAPLKQIEGALTMLGEVRAVELLRDCGERIERFAEPGQCLEQTDFEDVANKLSALGFFVEQLRHGAADLDAILRPRSVAVPTAKPEFVRSSLGEVDAAEVTKLTRTALDALRDRPSDEALRDEVRNNLQTLCEDAGPAVEQHAQAAIDVLDAANAELTAEDIAKLDQVVDALPSILPQRQDPSPEAVRLADASSEAIDAELLEIFLEEGHEVLATIADQIPRLVQQSHDHETLTVIRRAFHTLKGSGRMVGLVDLGEAAWSVEQVMNLWLKTDQGASPELMVMLEAARSLFSDWISCLERHEAPPDVSTSSVSDLHGLCARLLGVEVPGVREQAPPSNMPVADVGQLTPVERRDASSGLDLPVSAEVEPVETDAAAEPIEVPKADDAIVIGELVLSPMVFDIYLTEARGYLAILETQHPKLGEEPPPKDFLRAIHTLAGVSGTVGVRVVNVLGRALEHALERFAAVATPLCGPQLELMSQAVSTLASMVNSVSERRMPVMDDTLLEEIEGLSPSSHAQSSGVDVPAVTASAEQRSFNAPESNASAMLPELPSVLQLAVEPALAAGRTQVDGGDVPFADQRRKLRIHDDLDRQLLPIFLEEGTDLLREIGAELRAWRAAPEDSAIGPHLQRLLHTLKGSARMAGAMRMGELVHGMETRIVQATRHGAPPVPAFLDEADNFFDRALTMLDSLVRIEGGEVIGDEADSEALPEAHEPSLPSSGLEISAIAVQTSDPDSTVVLEAGESVGQRAQLRVRAELIDDLINEAGEMAIARARIEGEMRTLKSSLLDLTENVIRLRQQLREIEIQAETQMQSQLSQLQEVHQDFDPLEMDRFTRFQELTRMMAEGVNDVTTVQHNLLRNLDSANAALSAQSRLNRELSQSLMSVRMVPFNSIIDRLYRIVRQVAKELDKRVNLDLRGGQFELDRSVLEKMVGPIEHLLRNSIAHGIEGRESRRAAGKPEIGEIVISLVQQGNEIVIELADDGAGLNFERIRAKAIEQGLLAVDQVVDEKRLTQFIFSSGFSTAREVNAVAGRGVGMDVVRTETVSLGGRIEVQSQSGKGTRFRIFLPLTLAVTQALLVRSGTRTYALPSTMVEQVMELRPEAVEKIRLQGGAEWLDAHYPWHYLAQLLGEANGVPLPARRHWVLLLKGADQHIALEVDGLVGNQEIVVKNIGHQLARVPGVSGATVLNDGEIALILNPLALAGREHGEVGVTATIVSAPAVPRVVPTIMVVDDSLTVRKIVSRLLTREGYQVVTAKDGVDALEQLLDVIPTAMLVDIEMPRMDGFELTRNVRADTRLKDVPIIMITSRIADKHRNYAKEIGVNEYLGKPYDEDVLLDLLSGFAERRQAGA